MRLRALQVEGFRSFAARESFDLAADVILITGPNGTGKTSLLDAVLWALTGHVPRLGDHQDKVISLYAPFGFAEVQLELVDPSGSTYHVIRRFDGYDETLAFEDAGRTVEGQRAESALLEKLWPDSLSFEDGSSALAKVLTWCVYLEQDLVRRFVESEGDDERFLAVSEVVGATQVTELQTELERARGGWRKVMKAKNSELREAQSELEKLQSAMSRLGPEGESIADVYTRWTQWWSMARDLISISDVDSTLEHPRAANKLDQVLRRIQAERAAIDRKGTNARSLLDELNRAEKFLRPSDQEVSGCDAEVTRLRATLASLRKQLAEAQRRSSEERKRLTQLREAQEELKALASLAVRHLGDHCPVCAQEYNRKATEARLKQLLGEPEVTPRGEAETSVDRLSEQIPPVETELARVEAELAELHEQQAKASAWERSVRQRLLDLDIKAQPHKSVGVVRSLLLENEQKGRRVDGLYDDGEKLALELARLSEQGRRKEIQQDLLSTKKVVTSLANTYADYAHTDQTASELIEAVRDAADEAVGEKIGEIQPLLDRIYARIDPHPAFTRASLLVKHHYGKGRLLARIRDPHEDLPELDPFPILSSSQLNALAVSMFLSINLGVPSVPLDAALLDDPLQSLDDINLLGLFDVLRRTRGKRQLVISTHDDRLADLLERKLRPIDEDQRTRIIRIDSWTRTGPVVSAKDVPRTAPALKVVGA